MSLADLLNAMSFRVSDYFYGDIRREFVADRLNQDGDFLLRSTSEDGQFILSIRYKDHIYHYPAVHRTIGDRSTYTFDGQRAFVTFDALVKFHFATKVGLGEKREHLLLKPIRAPKYKYNESDIQVLKKVGAGSFGEVFKVLLKTDKIFLAMKVLKDSVTDEDRANFLKEIQMMKCMHHRNVVKFYGVITPVQADSKQLKVLLEYVNQGSLLRLLRKGKVTLRGKYKISLESAQGLAYLHVHNIIHRDIAARNILIQMTTEGVMTVKVSDFGLSRSDETGRGYELKTARRLPLKWMAPECFEKKLWTKASDVWSFAIMVWEIFENGREPFSDSESPQTPAALSKYICSGSINPRPSEISDSMWNLMKMCWTVEYSQRINILDVEQRLKEIILEQSAAASASATMQTPDASSISTTSASSPTSAILDAQNQAALATPSSTTAENQPSTATTTITGGRKSASAAPASGQTASSAEKNRAATSG